MKSIKSKDRIGIGLMLIAIALLLVNAYQSGAGIENRFVEVGSWIALLIAFAYKFWLSVEKKKLADNMPNTD